MLPTKFGAGNEGRENEIIYENTFQTWRDSFLFIWIEGEEVCFLFFFFFVYENPRPSNVNEMSLKTTGIYGGFVGTHLQNSTFAETSTYRFDHAFCVSINHF